MSGSKDAKFFCESCGAEVPKSSKFCPACGKFFASVRCPQCGKIGSNEDFKNGCPECGYARNKTPSATLPLPEEKKPEKRIFRGFRFSSAKKSSADGSLPVWIYVLTLVVLVILIICLYSCL